MKCWRSINRNLPVIEGSCYGYKIFGSYGGSEVSQWRRLVELIKADPSTRRAVLDLFDPDVGLDPHAADSPCACSLQFLVRGDRLHQVAHMRSNDAIWGLPYDVFIFTTLQELLACELGLELGAYSHMVGSIHLYDQHLALAERIVAEYDQGLVRDMEMSAMKGHYQVPLFVEEERSMRVEGVRARPPARTSRKSTGASRRPNGASPWVNTPSVRTSCAGRSRKRARRTPGRSRRATA
jgi:thymidylate synthase